MLHVSSSHVLGWGPARCDCLLQKIVKNAGWKVWPRPHSYIQGLLSAWCAGGWGKVVGRIASRREVASKTVSMLWVPLVFGTLWSCQGGEWIETWSYGCRQSVRICWRTFVIIDRDHVKWSRAVFHAPSAAEVQHVASNTVNHKRAHKQNPWNTMNNLNKYIVHHT